MADLDIDFGFTNLLVADGITCRVVQRGSGGELAESGKVKINLNGFRFAWPKTGPQAAIRRGGDAGAAMSGHHKGTVSFSGINTVSQPPQTGEVEIILTEADADKLMIEILPEYAIEALFGLIS